MCVDDLAVESIRLSGAFELHFKSLSESDAIIV